MFCVFFGNGEFSGAIFAGDIQMVQRLVECRADVNLACYREKVAKIAINHNKWTNK